MEDLLVFQKIGVANMNELSNILLRNPEGNVTFGFFKYLIRKTKFFPIEGLEYALEYLYEQEKVHNDRVITDAMYITRFHLAVILHKMTEYFL